MSRNPDDSYSRPFTGPIERAMRLQDAFEEIKFRKEQREQQRQLYKQQLEDYRRNREAQDLNTMLALHSFGAIATAPGEEQAEAALTAAYGNTTPESTRPVVSAPGGGRYRLPSQRDKRDKLMREAVDKGTAEGIAETMRDDAIEGAKRASGRVLRMKVPAFGDNPATEIWVDSDKYVATVKQIKELQRSAANGKIINGRLLTDKQTGESVFVGIDADTREAVEIPIETKLKPVPVTSKADPKAAAAERSARVAQATATRAEAARRRVQKLIEDARKYDTTTGLRSPKSQERSRELWDYAQREADAAIQQFPQHLKAGPRQGGYADIERIDSSGRAGQAKAAPPLQQQIDADEKAYQDAYEKLAPEKRQQLESLFEQEYGRKPRPPAKQGAMLAAPEGGDGARLVPASFRPDDPRDMQPPQNDFFPHDRVYPRPPKPRRDDQPTLDAVGGDWQGAYQTRVHVPPAVEPKLREWLEGDFQQDVLEQMGWSRETWRRWNKKHPNKMPPMTITAGKVDPKTRMATLRIPLRQAKLLRAFALPEIRRRKRLQEQARRASELRA